MGRKRLSEYLRIRVAACRVRFSPFFTPSLPKLPGHQLTECVVEGTSAYDNLSLVWTVNNHKAKLTALNGLQYLIHDLVRLSRLHSLC